MPLQFFRIHSINVLAKVDNLDIPRIILNLGKYFICNASMYTNYFN